MRSILLATLIFSLFALSFAQETPTATPTIDPSEPAARVSDDQAADPSSDLERFDAAMAISSAAERTTAFESFISDHPDSEKLPEAREALTIARAAMADDLVRAGDIAAGIEAFRRSIIEMPTPASDRLFDTIIVKIPTNVFFRGHRAEAFELAALIESQVVDDPARLTSVAAFHLSVENSSDAVRITQRALELNPELPEAYVTLGMAHRQNFDLEASAAAYEKAAELSPDDLAAIRGLADMRRALARPGEAAALYRRALEVAATDMLSRNGLVLSLFEAGQRSEAEAEMEAALRENPNNLMLLAGAAYWHAASGDGTRAVELANRAIAIEPRYVWSHIALARGLMLEGNPVEAEKRLLAARQYGNFPTMDYEIAAARIKAGFFRGAADELQRSFRIEDGAVSTRLGGRVERSGEDPASVIAAERQASILAPEGFGDREASNQLRALLELTEAVAADPPDEATVIAAAERFAGGEDAMKVHRQLFAASLLLDRRVAVSKAGELAAAATGMTDTALSVANPSAAVLASELYEARRTAALKNEFLIVPTVPKQTLSAIFRGRIEEIAARAYVETGDLENAQIRFRRAISVLPEKSSWWRSSKWRLGDVLAAEGKESEALAHYIDAYDQEKPDRFRYISIAALYSKVNDGIEGLEERIGPNPAPQIVEVANEPEKDDVPADVPGSDPPKERVGEITAPVEATVETIPPQEDATAKTAGNENETPQTENDRAAAEPAATEPEIADEAAEKAANEETPTLTLERVADADADRPEEDAVADPSETAVVRAEADDKKLPETGEKPTDATPVRSLFEPIIITVPGGRRTEAIPPKVQPPVSGDGETNDEPLPSEALTARENNAEPASDPDVKEPPATGISDAPEEQDDIDGLEAEVENGDENAAAADAAETDLSGAVRPRLVAGKAVSANVPVCEIKVSQDTVSVINGGGNLGLLVSIEGEGDITSVQATASSPDDISIVPEPAMIGIPGRAFFVIRSKSTNTGTYRVTFAAPCGTKDVAVEVR